MLKIGEPSPQFSVIIMKIRTKAYTIEEIEDIDAAD